MKKKNVAGLLVGVFLVHLPTGFVCGQTKPSEDSSLWVETPGVEPPKQTQQQAIPFTPPMPTPRSTKSVVPSWEPAPAATMEDPSWSWVATLSAGPAWSNSGETQTFFLQQDIEKSYSATHGVSTLGVGELFVGRQDRLGESNLYSQLGLAVAVATNAEITGDIWEEADPNFNNYTYRYNVSHMHVAMKGKLFMESWKIAEPYVSVSIGGGVNRSTNFGITPKIEQEIPAPAFTNHSTSSLIYTLGLGAQKRLTPTWRVGIGYEYGDWGSASLARAPGQTLNSGLSLGHLVTHQLQLSLTYVVPGRR